MAARAGVEPTTLRLKDGVHVNPNSTLNDISKP